MSAESIEVIHAENIPKGGAVIIPNRFCFTDLLHLEKVLGGRRPVYLALQTASLDPLVRNHLERHDVEALLFSPAPENEIEFKKVLNAKIAAHQLVVYIPGRARTRPGALTAVPSSVLAYIAGSGVPLLPLFIDHPAETRLQIEDFAAVDCTLFSFGHLLERESANLANYQEILMLAGEAAFNSRPALAQSLPWVVLQGLVRHGSTSRIVDGFDGSVTGFDKILAASVVLARLLRKSTSKKRVGIVLPPGRGGFIANIGVLLARKIPVNLNFTAATDSIESAIRQADLDLIITVEPFQQKCASFPWPPPGQIIYLERVLSRAKIQSLFWYLVSKCLPAGALATLLRIPREARGEAILLFTSGSSGEPKGVPLTHRNVIGNVNQFGSRIDLHHEDSVLGCLPLFHSFGCTVTLWYPLIEGVDTVTYPSPLEAGKLAELIEKHRVSLIIATPTFLRGYLRKAEKQQLASAKLVVTGAEKLPLKTEEAFRNRFDKPVNEGYGLTETSPVSNVNLPDARPDPDDDRIPVLPSTRLGSVGQPLPGVAIRITDPETGSLLPLHKTGMIWLRGANIFEGYLDRPDLTGEVIQDLWFRTGDIGRVDEDGFLYIEGRISRFSKIGGEMVPHETIEAAITRELDLDGDEHRKIAVVGIPDEAKGEALVLLSAHPDVDLTVLRYGLLAAGLPALWIPRTLIEADAIPVLASGKLDIKACEALARDGAK